MLLYYLIFLDLLLGYITIVYGLHKFGILKKYNISLALGFIIMWRTKRGRKFLNKLSRYRRFWQLYGNLAIAICVITMVFMFIILFMGAIVAISIRTEPPPLQNLLVLPGINPIIPLWYGIFALAVGIIVHEFSHGILARVAKIKVKSLGLLLCIVPIGAFVEPDEKEIEKINRRSRSRIFATGPTSNIIFALIFAGIFSWAFMASLSPTVDGVLVVNVTEDFPAEEAGIKPGMVITEIEGMDVNGTSLENVKIEKQEDFSNFLKSRQPNDVINLTVYENHKKMQFHNITLADKYNNTERTKDRGVGFLGVNTRGVEEFKNSLAYPVSSAGDNTAQRRYNLIQYFMLLPVDSKILPFHSPITEVYEVTGPLSVLPTTLFWILANMFFYLFWLNILLGIFNMIPAIPLDGGYVFKDGMSAVLARLRPAMKKDKLMATVNLLSFSLSFLIFILFMMIIMGPYLFAI